MLINLDCQKIGTLYRIYSQSACSSWLRSCGCYCNCSAFQSEKSKLVSIIAAIMVSVQIILGYLTVTAGLHPFVVATNLSTGITMIAFSMITFYWIGVMKNILSLNSTRLCNSLKSCCQIHSRLQGRSRVAQTKSSRRSIRSVSLPQWF